MKIFISVISFVLFISYAVAETPKLKVEELAIKAFDNYAKTALDKDLLAQVADLQKLGLERTKKAGVAVLSGQCGFAGCDYRVLLTVLFESKGANTQTDVVSAVVKVNSHVQAAEVVKVLTRSELEALQEN